MIGEFMTILRIIIGVLFTSIGGLFTYMFWSAHRVIVKKHVLDTPQSDSSLTLFFISDIHRRRIPKKLIDKLVSEIKHLDMIVIGGDIAEKGVPAERVRKNVRDLAQLGPVYYVWGNNDREIGEKTIRDIMKDVNGVILDNCSVRIPHHPDWIISGADDPSSGKANVSKSVAFPEEYAYQLIAVHNPSVFRKFVNLGKPTLLLGGHTHGGQIRFGSFGMQPRGSLEQLDNRAELISNGFGTTLVPLRFGAPPETHLITINYQKRSELNQYDEN